MLLPIRLILTDRMYETEHIVSLLPCFSVPIPSVIVVVCVALCFLLRYVSR